jgi:hypothetical protein
MTTTDDHDGGSTSGVDLILKGLVLALLGAGSVMLMVVGLSFLYVGRYGLGGGLLIGSLLAVGVFAGSYGPYLNRLERRADGLTRPSSFQPPPAPSEAAGTDSLNAGPGEVTHSPPPRQGSSEASHAPQPAPASRIIALATSFYGVLIVASGMIWTEGADLAYNLLAGAALLVCAVIVWRSGRNTTGGNNRPRT